MTDDDTPDMPSQDASPPQDAPLPPPPSPPSDTPAPSPEEPPPAPRERNALERLQLGVSAANFAAPLIHAGGIVTEVTPAYCRVSGLSQFVKLGECVTLNSDANAQLGEVVRVEENGTTIKTFDPVVNVGLGSIAWQRGFVTIRPHPLWKSRILNALGQPIDDGPPLLHGNRDISVEREPPSPMRRQRVETPMKTGVRVIDLFTPLCAGQRIGVFAGSGIGKSTLLGMLARARGFDTVVVALVGERGREVREFLEDSLSSESSRAIAVISTGDESPMMRRLAPKMAMCISEYFRDMGENVLLIVDSVTRYAHAAREVALAAGEPPVARGYTPSVFSDMPKLLERAGPGEEGAGSITGIFAVLVDGDDHNEPVADNIRGTLDGHIVLDRATADQGRYPAVNVLTSVSRLAGNIWTTEERNLIMKLRSMIARYEETRDLRLMGGYHSGTDPELDRALELVPRIFEVMKQSPSDPLSLNAFQEVAQALAS
ncbi:MAG: flagellar protein export ATPase FliI [Alphaproteobacteria bacterium]